MMAKNKSPSTEPPTSQRKTKAASVPQAGLRMDQPTERKPREPRPRGRPSAYEPQLALEILERVAEGELLIDICREVGMVAVATVYRWREAHADFREAFARAREMQAHAFAERAVQSARAADKETAHAERVRFDAYKWMAGKLLPREYSDKMDINHGGDINLRSVPDARIASRIVELLGKAGAAPTPGGAGAPEQPPED